MSDESVETVKVVSPVSVGNPHGYIVINKADLLPEHELFDEKPARVVEQPPRVRYSEKPAR